MHTCHRAELVCEGVTGCGAALLDSIPVCLQLSGERVLTMEWIDGCKLTDMDALVAMHVHPRDVAIELLHAFAQMTFVDGFGEHLSHHVPFSDRKYTYYTLFRTEL